MKTGWKLINGEKSAERNPRTFYIPPRADREGMKPGSIVKIGIRNLDFHDSRRVNAERFWAVIEGVCPAGSIFAGHYYGRVDNDLVLSDVHDIRYNMRVVFRPEHILQTTPPPIGALPPRASKACLAMRQRLRAN